MSSPDDPLEMEAEAVAQHALLQERSAAGLREQRWAPGVSQATTSLVVHRQAGRFTPEQVEPVRKAYEENVEATKKSEVVGGVPIDRAACIVMLNVALAKLFPEDLRTKMSVAHGRTKDRPKSKRMVEMADLPVGDVKDAMEMLRQLKLADKPIRIDFPDKRGGWNGALPPGPMRGSAQAKILEQVGTDAGWYFFGMSILHGYHSVLVAVEVTGDKKLMHWLDQRSTSIDEEVTDFDERLTKRTHDYYELSPKSDTYTMIWPIHGKLPATPRR